MPLPSVDRRFRTWPIPALGFLVAITICLTLLGPAPQTPAATPSAADGRPVFDLQTDIHPLLQKYCLDCHSGTEAEAGVDLAKLLESPLGQHRKAWEKALDLVRLENMPPADAERPTTDERAKLTSWLDDALFYVDCSQPADPGQVTVRRLNRAEFSNTVRDLLGVAFDATADFPIDDVGYGFDNIGDVLTVPPLLIEKYLDAAEQITSRAILTPEQRQAPSTIPVDLLAGPEVAEGPEGSVQIAKTSEASFPVRVNESGRYRLTLTAFADSGGDEATRIELRQNGRVLRDIALPGRKRVRDYTIETVFHAGEQRFFIAFMNNLVDQKRRIDRNVYLKSIRLEGPLDPPSLFPPKHQQLVAVRPDAQHSAEQAAAENLGPFLRKAFRRPVSAEEVQGYARFVPMTMERKGSFERGMQIAIQAVLVSPDFLFRRERVRELDRDGRGILDDASLASRISYFLWSSQPDDELQAAADSGKLRDEAVLVAQVRRMLKDPKSSALVDNFASQWLALRKLKTEDVNPSKEQFPDFNDQLRDDMQRETRLFVESIIRDDRSIIELLTGRYTFINERLAKLYGIEGVQGDEFRRVELTDGHRVGLLTQPAVLTLTSYPGRTSPVKRGQWVLETLLGDEPPPPPPGVPGLDATQKSHGDLPLRKQLELHRADPGCNACHKVMDEIGFGLENFDAIGRWRDKEGSFPVDSSGKLPSGEEFRGPTELVSILAGQQEKFRRCVAEKLLTYALGRGVEYFDRCAVDQIVTRLENNDSHFSELVVGIVLSDPFRLTRVDAAKNETARH